MITNNYKAILSSNLVSVDGENTPLLPVTGTDGTTYYLCGNGDEGFPTTVGDDVTLSASAAGIMLGTGDTEADETDTALDEPITSGISASAVHTRGMSDGNPYIEYTITVENTGYSAIILNEVGYIQTVYASASQSSAGAPLTVAVLLERTVFSTPITVAAGATKYIKYRMASAPGSGGGGGATLITKTVTANGTYNASSDSADGYSSVEVDVPNTYAAADEGKVVSNGALVAQTARATAITENGTYDTTGNNSVTVNVSGGGGGGVSRGTTPPSAATGSNGDFYIQTAADGILTSDGACYINTNITQNALYKVEIEAAMTAQTTSSYDTLFGCRNGSYARFTARFGSEAASALEVHKSATPTGSYKTGTTGETKATMLNTFKKITVRDFSATDDFVKTALATTNTDDFPYAIFVFANNDAGSPGDYAMCAVKSFKMWDEDGTLIMYLIPATHNGVACMYDLVSGNYFTNSGNGTFTHTDDGTSRDALLWEKINGMWKIVAEMI